MLAGCGGAPYTEVTFHNDLGRPATIALCRDGVEDCRQVRWQFGIDPGGHATQAIPSDGATARRFLVVGQPEVVYGCLAFAFDGRQPAQQVDLSEAGGCGSGRPARRSD